MDDSQESRRIAASLARKAGVDASAAQVADAVLVTCQAIESALAPIIGPRGVAALHRRSLLLAARTHPWLASTPVSDQAAESPSTFQKALLSRQTSAEAAQGGAAYLQAFYDLLISLVGPSLTERLLRRVWMDFLGAPPAQDTES